MIAAVDRALELCGDATRIVPGHGPLAGRTDLVEYRSVLREFRDSAAAAVAAGADLDAVLADPPTTDLDEEYGQNMFPPDAFTRLVWLSLHRPAGDRP